MNKRDCLYCKRPTVQVVGVNSSEFLIETIKCSFCGKTWKDFRGVVDATSPIISIQRNTGSSDSKPIKPEGNDKLPEDNKNN